MFKMNVKNGFNGVYPEPAYGLSLKLCDEVTKIKTSQFFCFSTLHLSGF
jgi:hypothetical protein